MAIEITADQIRAYVEVTDQLADQLVEDAIDQAEIVAPGISDLTGQQARSAAAVIRGAIVRYLETGSDGTTQTQDTLGPYSQSTSYQTHTTLFLPSEERKLAKLVEQGKHKAFMVDMTPEPPRRPCGVCAPGVCLSCHGRCW
ncbi:hypothetical protein PQI66_00330 [Corynebacterium sp. USCH3]|uniref:hypothetical protein n=1 Tax=Corynebacterium sp. USCH3 TaxID=3024840 RepID=UPI0030963F53